MELLEISIYVFNYEMLKSFINYNDINDIYIFLNYHKCCLYDKIYVNILFLSGMNLFIKLNKQLINIFNIFKNTDILNINTCISFDNFSINKNKNILNINSGNYVHEIIRNNYEIFNKQIRHYNLYENYSEYDLYNINNNISKCCPVYYKKSINGIKLFVCNTIVLDYYAYEGYIFAMKLFYNCGFNLWQKMLEHNYNLISSYNITLEIIKEHNIVYL